MWLPCEWTSTDGLDRLPAVWPRLFLDAKSDLDRKTEVAALIKDGYDGKEMTGKNGAKLVDIRTIVILDILGNIVYTLYSLKYLTLLYVVVISHWFSNSCGLYLAISQGIRQV